MLHATRNKHKLSKNTENKREKERKKEGESLYCVCVKAAKKPPKNNNNNNFNYRRRRRCTSEFQAAHECGSRAKTVTSTTVAPAKNSDNA